MEANMVYSQQPYQRNPFVPETDHHVSIPMDINPQIQWNTWNQRYDKKEMRKMQKEAIMYLFLWIGCVCVCGYLFFNKVSLV